MTNDAALNAVRLLGGACAFVCGGDVLFAMGGRCLSHADVNAALATAVSCAACASGWRVTTVDQFGDTLVVELRLSPATVISLGP